MQEMCLMGFVGEMLVGRHALDLDKYMGTQSSQDVQRAGQHPSHPAPEPWIAAAPAHLHSMQGLKDPSLAPLLE
jgi:hypothetical protein